MVALGTLISAFWILSANTIIFGFGSDDLAKRPRSAVNETLRSA